MENDTENCLESDVQFVFPSNDTCDIQSKIEDLTNLNLTFNAYIQKIRSNSVSSFNVESI